MTTCVNPINQTIYNALITQANSYPADRPYWSRGYRTVAELIATCEYDLYKEFTYSNRGITPHLDEFIDAEILHFIEDFILMSPTYLALTTVKPISLPAPVYTPENPRRSKRNIGKPPVKYFSEDYDDYEILDTMKTICDKKNWHFNEDFLDEFNSWLPTTYKYDREKYNYKTNKFIPKTKLEMAKYWIMNFCDSINKQKNIKMYNRFILKYCKKYGIEYDPLMYEKFALWMADPANKYLITYTYTEYDECTCLECNPNGDNKGTEYTVVCVPQHCVKIWVSTLKKMVAL